jgi:hypothetical protein
VEGHEFTRADKSSKYIRASAPEAGARRFRVLCGRAGLVLKIHRERISRTVRVPDSIAFGAIEWGTVYDTKALDRVYHKWYIFE